MFRAWVLVVCLCTPGLLGQDTDVEDIPEAGRPLVRCRRPMCMMYCPLGFQTDDTGCPVCSCLQDPCKQPESDVLLLPEICPPNTKCESKSCSKHPCTQLPVQCSPTTISEPEPQMPCAMPMCANECPSGYALDKRGCMSCRCKEPSCEGHKCGKGQRCQLHMKPCDHDVCEMVPICVKDDKIHPESRTGATDCPDLQCGFEIACEYGYMKDQNGCPVCDCNADPCDDHECIEGTVCEARMEECEEGNCPIIPICKAEPLCHMAQSMWDMMRDVPHMGDAPMGIMEGMDRQMDSMMRDMMGPEGLPPMPPLPQMPMDIPGLMDHPMFGPQGGLDYDRPMCDNDLGHFMPRQCHKQHGDCWCVDDRGVEVPGTRTKGSLQCSRNHTVSLDLNMMMHHGDLNLMEHLEEMQRLMRERMSDLMMMEEQSISVCEISPMLEDSDEPQFQLHIVVIHDGQSDLPSVATLLRRQLQAGQGDLPFQGHTITIQPDTVQVHHKFEQDILPPQLPDQPLRPEVVEPEIIVGPIEPPRPVTCWTRMGVYYRNHKMAVVIAVSGAVIILMLTVAIGLVIRRRKMASYQFRHKRFENMDNFKKNLVLSNESDLVPESITGEGKVLPAPEVCVSPEMEQKVTLA